MKITRLLIVIMLVANIRVFSQIFNDGPYVLHKEGHVVVKAIENSKLLERSILLTDRAAFKVPVRFVKHVEWKFTVPLKERHGIEPSETAQPEKLLFVSDIEGEFDGFRRLLVEGGVIDEKYNWTFGKGHLVVCGDLFDRGSQVTECMWLLYKLEDLAKSAGGYVHVILGNHDIMNLSGDLRYVQPKYFESAKLMGMDYMDLYSVSSELGRWLRTKNIIEKIGDNLCAHAGIAPQINKPGLSLTEINEKCRPYYDKARSVKEAGDERLPAFFSGTTSPFWYRGYFHEPKATEAEVDETLRLFGVNRIVVGHTIVPGNVGFYYGSKVLGLDVDGHSGVHQAALYANGQWYKVDDKGMKVELKIN